MDNKRPRKRALSHQGDPAAQSAPKKKAPQKKSKAAKERKEKHLTVQKRGRKRPPRNTNVQSPPSDWLPDLGLDIYDRIQLESDSGVSGRFFYAAETLLKKQFQDKNGLPCIRTVTDQSAITPTTKPTVQFHIERMHAYVTACDGQKVVIADSGDKSELGDVCYKMIEESYKNILKDPLSNIQILEVQEQPPCSWDCAIYSISNAYELLVPDGNPECYYHQGLVRGHLVQCLENGEITEFPKAYKPYVWSNPPIPPFDWKSWKP